MSAQWLIWVTLVVRILGTKADQGQRRHFCLTCYLIQMAATYGFQEGQTLFKAVPQGKLKFQRVQWCSLTALSFEVNFIPGFYGKQDCLSKWVGKNEQLTQPIGCNYSEIYWVKFCVLATGFALHRLALSGQKVMLWELRRSLGLLFWFLAVVKSYQAKAPVLALRWDPTRHILVYQDISVQETWFSELCIY